MRTARRAPGRQEELLLHSLVLRLELPVHGHGEAEQAAAIAVLPHDIVQVQVEGGQPATSEQKNDEQRQSTGGPGLHASDTGSKVLAEKGEKSCCCCFCCWEPVCLSARLSVCVCVCVQEGRLLDPSLPAAPPTGLPWHTHIALPHLKLVNLLWIDNFKTPCKIFFLNLVDFWKKKN